MKKYLISFLAIFSVLPAMANITVSGRVVDENNKPLLGAAVLVSGTTRGISTDENGNFSINNVPENNKIEVSYIGYEPQTVTAGQNLTIKMEISAVRLKTPQIIACQAKGNNKSEIYDVYSEKCYPTACVSDRYVLTNPRTVKKSSKATSYICLGSSEEDGPCEDFCTDDTDKCTVIQIGDACEDQDGKECKADDPNALEAEYKWENNKLVCNITKCTERYLLKGGTCEDQVGKKCDSGDPNAAEAKYKWKDNKLVCEISKCNKTYLPNDDGTACEKSEGPCTEEQIKQIEHATAGELKNKVCHATDCDGGYDPKDGKCVEISGDCETMPKNAIAAHREWDAASNSEVCIVDDCKDNMRVSDDKKSCVSTLSEADSEAKIEELQKNADAMKKREQSTANKLLGGASIGAMGIGGMQVASALAEQNADSAAERDMTAYIATFKCDYGQSGMIQGGESNITLPGANVLLPIYNEYVTLATDLKARKEALGMSPGIESELVLDAATSGLYDNEGTGINGTYTSLYRALTDEDGEDAAAWAAQKSDTASQLKTGAITAGAGALVGVVGNILINEVGDKPKELSDEIIAKYDAKRKTIREELEPVEEQSKSEATRNAPNVETNKSSTQKSADQLGCENSGGTWSNLSCTCPASKPQWDPTNRKCIEKTELIKSTITGLNIESGTTLLSKALAIPTNVTKGSPKPIVTLYNESMFDSGKTEIKNPTTKLDNVIEELKTKTADETDFEIVLVAHTDKDQIIPTSNLCKNDKICTNMELSQARANSVKDYIEKKWSNMPSTAKITTKPVGDTCAKGVTSNTKALDRRVDFYVFFDGEDSSKIEACKANQ